MKLALMTDAWQPQVNGVVTTLVELVKQLRRKICEDVRVFSIMCIGKMAGCVILPQFLHLTGKCKDTVCTE